VVKYRTLTVAEAMLNTILQVRPSLLIELNTLSVLAVYLNRICQTMKDKSALEIVNANTIRQTHKRLIYKLILVSEIAFTLQLPDTSYFTRFFYKQTGLSPHAYRNQSLLGASAGAEG
jgi:AraC-like DNA-binding protein